MFRLVNARGKWLLGLYRYCNPRKDDQGDMKTAETVALET